MGEIQTGAQPKAHKVREKRLKYINRNLKKYRRLIKWQNVECLLRK